MAALSRITLPAPLGTTTNSGIMLAYLYLSVAHVEHFSFCQFLEHEANYPLQQKISLSSVYKLDLIQINQCIICETKKMGGRIVSGSDSAKSPA
jgi:hypothetical protein